MVLASEYIIQVENDPIAAVAWWQKAAEQGHVKARKNVGIALYSGAGVFQDKEESGKWESV